MMELKDTTTNASDDEDLEQLRLAALQSLKKPNTSKIPNENTGRYNGNNSANHFHSTTPYHKKNRTYNRNMRMNTGNNRVRNTNLIAIPTVEQEKSDKENSTPKLILPQDRYCNNVQNEVDNDDEKGIEQKSKFNRYDNSDDSDSDSDTLQLNNSDDEVKLERSNSLEALMQELENEIQGDSKIKQDKMKSKLKIRKVKSKQEDSNQDVHVSKDSEKKVVAEAAKQIEKIDSLNEKTTGKIDKIEVLKNDHEKVLDMHVRSLDKNEKRIPNEFEKKIFPRGNLNSNKRHNVVRKFNNRHRQQIDARQKPYVPNITTPYLLQNIPYQNEQFPNQNIPSYDSNFMYNHNPMPVIRSQMPIPVANNYVPIQRPLTPLLINTDPIKISMAPLSPRSAAFVLENREIIERRKKSPRRSYSRSPSPRYRLAKSPRRSLSPRNSNRRSNSPRKFNKQSSLSPRQRISPAKDKYTKNISPNRYNRNPSPNIPIKDLSPMEKKVPIKERLGSRSEKSHEERKPLKRSRSTSLTRSPDTKSVKVEDPPVEQELTNNPILEARKKKFENNEVVHKEGIIRLKPQKTDDEIAPLEVDEKIDEDEDLLEIDDFIDTKVDDLFSDEESDIENEGRFKLKTNTETKPSVINKKTYSKEITKESERKIRKTSSRERKRGSHNRTRETYAIQREDTNSKRELKERASFKHRISIKTSEKEKKPVTSPIENKKIEIKIRNPSKYENLTKEEKSGKTVRKVEVAKMHLIENDEPEPEIIIDNEDDIEEINDKGGDLRAQLSRKRAERQNKLPISENFQSRLLQNALEEVVYKQKSKKLKSKRSLELSKDHSIISKRTPLYTDSYYIKIGLGNENHFMKNESNQRTVHVVECRTSKIVIGATDTKVPIHLRLGRSSGLLEKSRKNRDLDQV